MSEKISIKDLVEHISEERLRCACGQASFDVPSEENGEVSFINLIIGNGGLKEIGPFVIIMCRHCGVVKFLHVPTVLRSKELRQKWNEEIKESHPDSQIEQSDAEAAADQSADDRL